MRVVAAPDKFRGTATAAEVAAPIARAVEAAGRTCDQVPMADGGEGTLDVLGGANRTTTVTGPLGDPVEAAWRLDRRRGGDRDGPGLGAASWSAAPRATTRSAADHHRHRAS